jgi:hypothetical protein
MVIHTCNPSYFRTSGAKSSRDPISTNKLGAVAHSYGPSYLGDRDRRIAVQDRLGQKYETPSKKG